MRIRRSLRWGKDLVPIIRRCNGASNGRWPMARWRHLMTDRDRAKTPRSRRKPKLGWYPWRDGYPTPRSKSAAGLAGIINRETEHWTDAARAAELGLPQVARAAWTLGRTKRVRMDYAAGAADGAA